MRKFWFAVALILFVSIGILFWEKKHSGTADSNLPGGSGSETSGAQGSRRGGPNGPADSSSAGDSQNSLASRAASPVSAPESSDAQQLAPLTVLDNARVAIHNYNAQFGENPTGDNAEITAALMGKNPKQINFIRSDSGLRVNEKGEMVDAYGTPFFFHQLSGHEMEIRSAGQDKIMWTFDDQTVR